MVRMAWTRKLFVFALWLATTATAVQYPSFGHSLKNNTVCMASLVHNDLLLTTADCQGAFSDGVMIGGSMLRGDDAPVHATIQAEFVHPHYEHGSALHNLMMVKLSEPLHREIVATNKEKELPLEGSTIKTIGFGRDNGHLMDTMQEEFVETIDVESCEHKYEGRGVYIASNAMFCSASEDNVCVGNSGSPVLDRRGQLVGIITGGDKCNSLELPVLNARLANYQTFIFQSKCFFSSLELKVKCPEESIFDFSLAKRVVPRESGEADKLNDPHGVATPTESLDVLEDSVVDDSSISTEPDGPLLSHQEEKKHEQSAPTEPDLQPVTDEEDLDESSSPTELDPMSQQQEDVDKLSELVDVSATDSNATSHIEANKNEEESSSDPDKPATNELNFTDTEDLEHMQDSFSGYVGGNSSTVEDTDPGEIQGHVKNTAASKGPDLNALLQNSKNLSAVKEATVATTTTTDQSDELDKDSIDTDPSSQEGGGNGDDSKAPPLDPMSLLATVKATGGQPNNGKSAEPKINEDPSFVSNDSTNYTIDVLGNIGKNDTTTNNEATENADKDFDDSESGGLDLMALIDAGKEDLGNTAKTTEEPSEPADLDATDAVISGDEGVSDQSSMHAIQTDSSTISVMSQDETYKSNESPLDAVPAAQALSTNSTEDYDKESSPPSSLRGSLIEPSQEAEKNSTNPLSTAANWLANHFPGMKHDNDNDKSVSNVPTNETAMQDTEKNSTNPLSTAANWLANHIPGIKHDNKESSTLEDESVKNMPTNETTMEQDNTSDKDHTVSKNQTESGQGKKQNGTNGKENKGTKQSSLNGTGGTNNGGEKDENTDTPNKKDNGGNKRKKKKNQQKKKGNQANKGLKGKQGKNTTDTPDNTEVESSTSKPDNSTGILETVASMFSPGKGPSDAKQETKKDESGADLSKNDEKAKPTKFDATKDTTDVDIDQAPGIFDKITSLLPGNHSHSQEVGKSLPKDAEEVGSDSGEDSQSPESIDDTASDDNTNPILNMVASLLPGKGQGSDKGKNNKDSHSPVDEAKEKSGQNDVQSLRGADTGKKGSDKKEDYQGAKLDVSISQGDNIDSSSDEDDHSGSLLSSIQSILDNTNEDEEASGEYVDSTTDEQAETSAEGNEETSASSDMSISGLLDQLDSTESSTSEGGDGEAGSDEMGNQSEDPEESEDSSEPLDTVAKYANKAGKWLKSIKIKKSDCPETDSCKLFGVNGSIHYATLGGQCYKVCDISQYSATFGWHCGRCPEEMEP